MAVREGEGCGNESAAGELRLPERVRIVAGELVKWITAGDLTGKCRALF